MDNEELFEKVYENLGGIEPMRKAFERFAKEKEIKSNQLVKVKDWGSNYSYYYDWFLDHNISRNLCLRYAYGKSMCNQTDYDEDAIFKVIAVYDGKALITYNGLCGEFDEYGVCHLVDVDVLIVVEDDDDEELCCGIGK